MRSLRRPCSSRTRPTHRRAAEADGTAYTFVPASGDPIERHSFGDLDRRSNRVVHLLGELGVRRGDRAFVMIPRIPAFYEVVIGAIKAGVVAMPGTNLLQGKDIAYRIRRAEARLAIVTAAHAEKVEAIRDQCPTLEQVVVIGDRRPGWVPYETALEGFPDTLAPAQRVETRSDEPMLIHFTSGTTWQATTDAGLMIAPLHENPERVSAHADVPSAVDDLFDRALARDPDDRFEPVEAFSEALADAVSGRMSGWKTRPLPADEPLPSKGGSERALSR